MQHFSGKSEKNHITFLKIIVFAGFFLYLMAMTKSSMPTQAAVKKMADNTNGKYLYYASDGTIYRLDTVSGKNKKIKTFTESHLVDNISYYKGYLYFYIDYYSANGDGWWAPYICRIKTNGTGFQRLAFGYKPVIYDGKIYFMRTKKIERTNAKVVGIAKMSLTGKNIKRLISGSYEGLRIINGKLYYTHHDSISDGDFLYQASLNGKNRKKIFHQSIGGDYGVKLVSDNSHLYFATADALYRLSGSNGKIVKLTDMPYYFLQGKGEVAEFELLSANKGNIYYCDKSVSGKDILKVYKTAKKKKVSIWTCEHWIDNFQVGKGKYAVIDHAIDGEDIVDPKSGGTWTVADMATAKMTVSGKKYKVIQKYYVP